MTAERRQPITTRRANDIIAHGCDGPVSVAQLLAHAAALADALPQRDYVINVAGDRYRFLLGFCAAVIAGQCTLMPPNRQRQTFRQLVAEYPSCYSFGDTGIEGLEYYSDELTIPDHGRVDLPHIPDAQLCAIAFTSGSTGESTPNRKYWKTIRLSTRSNARLLLGGQTEPVNLLATVPPQHMWGFETSILLPLFADVAVSHQSPLFPQDIADALAALDEPRALVSSPVHLEALLQAETGEVHVDYIYSATAPMSAELAQRLEDRFAARVIEIFGCSEAGTFAARQTASESLWRLAEPFALVAASDGALIRAGHLPEEVRLQDVVELVDDDHFRWLGRHQDMVNIAGKRGSLADLNQRLNAVPGVVDGVIFMPRSDSKRLAAMVVAPGLEPSAILGALKPGLDPAFLPRPLYLVPQLPRQETGKLARKALVELFAETQQSRKTTHEEPADDTD